MRDEDNFWVFAILGVLMPPLALIYLCREKIWEGLCRIPAKYYIGAVLYIVACVVFPPMMLLMVPFALLLVIFLNAITLGM